MNGDEPACWMLEKSVPKNLWDPTIISPRNSARSHYRLLPCDNISRLIHSTTKDSSINLSQGSIAAMHFHLVEHCDDHQPFPRCRSTTFTSPWQAQTNSGEMC